MINYVRGYTKFTIVVFSLVTYLFVSAITLLCRKDKRVSHKTLRLRQRFIRFVMRVLNVNIRISGAEILPKNSLIVANHQSYLDVLAIDYHCSSVFVTSKEMENTAFLGDLCKNSGCLFVNRQSIMGLKKEINEISNVLDRGFNVVIFPEATTSDASRVLPFRSSLIESAVKSGKPINPVAINYTTINGIPLNIGNRDTVCWYSTMGFLDHLFKLSMVGSVEMTLDFMDPLRSNCHRNRKELTAIARSMITKCVDCLPPSQSRNLEYFTGDRVVRFD